MSRNPIDPARLFWKMYWRQSRIIRRETHKQLIDALYHGTGYVKIGDDVPDYIQHVSLHDIFAPAK